MKYQTLIPVLALGAAVGLSGTANAAQFTYAYSVCKDGTVRSCGAGHTQVYCESKCSDHEGLAKRFYTTLEVPHKYRKSPETWREGLEESYDQALHYYDEVLQPLLEAQRKAEEDARKAKEAAKEDARKAKEAAKEKEREDCIAKMVYPVKVWACPFGNYVSDPTTCEKDRYGRDMGKHAVEVPLGVLILPPGESCMGQTHWEDATHESMLEAQLDKSNATCNSWKRGPECPNKTSPLYLASEKAYNDYSKAHDAWWRSLPYDCLAGVCLNAPATRIPDKLVTVSEVVMHRKVEVCSGRVVKVSVWAGWVHPRYGGFADILEGAQHTTYTDGTPATDHVHQVRSEMESMGWVKSYEDDFYTQYLSATKKGERGSGWGRSNNGGSWVMSLTTTHPDYDALCASKRREGL